MARRLPKLFGRREFESELEEELRFHLEERTKENLAAGMSPEQARRAARRALGNPETLKESMREAWMPGAIEGIWREARYAVRSLTKSPGFTLAAVLALELGIGTNTAIFSIVSAAYLRPLPLKDASRLVTFAAPPVTRWLPTTQKGQASGHAHVSWIDRVHTIEFPTLCLSGPVSLDSGAGAEALGQIQISEVSSNFFRLFGLEPKIGRGLGPETRGETVAELSYGFWQERYGGSPAVLGKTIELNGKPFTVIGVLPKGFDFPDWTRVWTPLPAESTSAFPGLSGMRQVARLAPGASLAQADAELDAIVKTLPFSIMQALSRHARAESLQRSLVGFTGPLVLLLSAAVVLLLLIACADVANLLLARGADRFQELALRSALGATRGRLVRELLTESLLISVAGAGLGVLIGWPGIELARAVAPVSPLLARGITLDSRVLGFAVAAALATTILSGLLPALAASRLAPGEALRSSAPGAVGPGRSWAASRLRNLLAVAQIALACTLTISAGLLVHSFWKIVHVNPGFRAAHVVSTEVSLVGTAYKTPTSQAVFYQRVLERVRALPGVQDAAFGPPPAL